MAALNLVSLTLRYLADGNLGGKLNSWVGWEHSELSSNHSSRLNPRLVRPRKTFGKPINSTAYKSARRTVLQVFCNNSKMASLYANVDEEKLRRDAENSLLHFGTTFYPEFITNASAQTITTASGHRMLDWTSGKRSKQLFQQRLMG